MNKYFIKMKEWDFLKDICIRATSIEIRGLPPQFWFEDTFRSIAELWGNLVEIEDRTCNLKDFRVAKVLISTNIMEKIEEK